MITNLFVIVNVKQLRTGGSFRILLPVFRTSWGVGVLNSAFFNSFHIRVEFGTILYVPHRHPLLNWLHTVNSLASLFQYGARSFLWIGIWRSVALPVVWSLIHRIKLYYFSKKELGVSARTMYPFIADLKIVTSWAWYWMGNRFNKLLNNYKSIQLGNTTAVRERETITK